MDSSPPNEKALGRAASSRVPCSAGLGGCGSVLNLPHIVYRSSSIANVTNATQATVKITVRAMKRPNPLM
jgi:hypothetical protein